MDIVFTPLQKKHFSLLLKWLAMPHVQQWWDPDIQWSEALIEQKYSSYVDGYKILGDIQKPMHAFIIEADHQPVGYIQYYDKYDFPPEQGYVVDGLPESLAALDFYIGEDAYLGKGIGAQLLKEFLKSYVFQEFSACFVDPDASNAIAIHTYKKAGFTVVKDIDELAVTWMVVHTK